jgi:peptidoglycan/xylan/chitin deacetylase (PgdA/CDA1 family)
MYPLLLVYHDIDEGDRPQGGVEEKVYTIGREAFTGQMEYLRQQRYAVTSLGDYLGAASEGGRSDGKPIIVTFDDGHVSHFEVAYPVLKAFEFRATFFITVDWIGSAGFLCWEHVKELSEEGMEIGSHTVSHPYLTQVPLEEVRRELEQSKAILEDKLGKSVGFLCAPGGYYNDPVKKVAQEVGYVGMCTTGWSGHLPFEDMYDLKRLGIGRNHSLDDFVGLVEMRKKAMLLRRIEVFLKPIVKRGLGVKRYRWFREKSSDVIQWRAKRRGQHHVN